jgi:glycosyltransferase involved in cell wall biosynthesis
MICGRPVVASDVGGSKEWIDDKKNGFIAESASKSAFEKAMLEACSNHTSWKEIGEAAHLKAIELYDPNPGKTLLKHLN